MVVCGCHCCGLQVPVLVAVAGVVRWSSLLLVGWRWAVVVVHASLWVLITIAGVW